LTPAAPRESKEEKYSRPMDLSDDMSEEDLYKRYKELQRELEFINTQEEYIKDEMKNLKRELIRAKGERR